MPTLDEAIGSNPLDSAIDGVTQDKTRLRASLLGAVKQNPDEAAQATQLSRTTGLPAPIIARNLQSVRQRATIDALDAAIDTGSIVGRKMADPGFAALGHDDVGNLNAIEQTMNRSSGKIGIPFRRQDELRNSTGPEVSTSSVVSGILKSLPQGMELTKQGIRAQFADAMGFDAMSADAIKMGQRAQHDVHLSTPRFESSTAGAAYSGMTSLLRQMPGLAATIATRSPMPGLSTIGVQTEAEAYNKYRARGATPVMAAVGGLGEGVVEVGTEMLPMSFLVNKFGKIGATQFLTGLLAREVPTEQIATLVQDAIDTAIANPDKTWKQYAAERPGAAYHTLIATVVQGGAMGAISEVARRIGEPTAKAEQATKNAAAIEQISKLATESKLRTRDPQTFQEFVHAATEGGPVQDVYLDARVLAQSGVDVKALVQASPTAAAQLEHALATGGDVVIPVSEYAARIAGTPLDPILSPHLRTSEDALSLDEAQRFYQGQAASFQETAAKVMEEKAGDALHAASAKAVETKLSEQLATAGRFTPDVNKAYASLMRDFYVATASRMGLTPEQMYERYPLQIKAESVAGAQRLDQPPEEPLTQTINPLQRLAQAVKSAIGIQTPEAAPKEEGARLDMGQFFQDKPDLVIQHNLGADNLMHALKMGGIPVPSLAITKKDHPLTGFGEITLIGSKDLADPKGYAGTKVYGSDIYSPRYPGFEYQFTRNMEGRVEGILKEGLDATNSYLDWDEISKRGAEEIARSPAFMWKFLNDKGITPEIVRTLPKELPEGIRKFADGEKDYFALRDDVEFIAAAYRAEADRLIPAYDGDMSAVQEEINDIKKKAAERGVDYLVRSYAKDVVDYQRDAANAGAIDKSATSRAIEDQIYSNGLMDEKNAAAKELLDEIAPNERIFQGFTYGGKRRYVPHTLENVVKILKKSLRGGEGFNYGVGSIRSAFTPQFKSVEQIRKSKSRLMDAAAFEKVKDEIDTEFFGLRDKLTKFHSASDGFGFADTVSSMMYDSATMGITRALNENGFDDVPQDYRQEISEFLSKLRDLPSEYFEAKILRNVDLSEFSGAVVPDGIDKKVVDALNSKGIKDIRFYKEGDDADRRAKIGEFENLFFQGNRGEISFGEDVSQEPSVITLFKNADLSTALHELGHFQLEVMANIAGRPDAPQAIVDDLNTVFEWFGIKGEGRTPLEVWNAMSLEEKRPYHEQFARGFEAYLFEGKSPSLEMSSVFARFRAWLVSVYKSIKALNVEISDDIRKVFDRLVATEEAIKQAEAARNYYPIFKTAEEMGATPEEFAEYQRTGEQAPQDAISELQSRSLRDMQWLTNARGRILKQLQKDAAAKRRETRMEARREVLSDPTYRAWQFLTRKMGAEDQLPAMQQKSDPDTLDETRDSLLVAIAKLGGLRKDQVISEWGTDPADKPSSGLFGKPVWRIEGGLSIDGMAEALAQHGYLPKNEHGQHDLHDFEEAFADEMRGNPRYSTAHEYTQEMPAGYQVANPAALDAGRLDLVELRQLGIPDDVIAKLESRGMIATGDGLHPDIVAEIVGGFTSGDEMVRKVAAADDINDVIEGVTDQHMLERYGDIASPEALARAADSAIHNEARGRFVATELKALSKVVGPVRAITKAAKDFAESVVARKLVRDIKPLQHAAAEVRAGKAAEKALIDGDTAQAVIEKRNQLVQNYSTRAAYDALDEIDTAVRYLRKFDKEGTRKNIDHEFTDQIDQLLERFDLRVSVTNKAAAQRSSLLSWVESQREQGFEPDIPPEILSEALRKPYKELTLEELRGLVDTVKQVEHLGRLKKKLLTAQDQLEFQAVVATLTASIEANAKHTADLRTRNTTTAQLKDAGNRFLSMHRKMASVAREMDGFQDGGPMWEYFIRSMNAAGDKETTRRADATARLYKLVKPFDKMGGKGQFFETLGASFNREERIAIALNLGNEGNMQRLLDGEGWTMEKLKPLLDTITPEEADFVQAIWDFFESYRPEIGAKETRIYGKEPKWVDPAPIMLGGRQLRGGYYPIKYDPARSGRAEQHAEAEAAKQQMRGAYTTATTRRSFTKTRAREVTGRPLIYSFAGLYQGTTEVIHDLSWHEWLIDVNRLIRAVDAPIRAHYGAETVGIFKKAVEDIATGDSQVQNVFERGLNHLRTGATVAGLGWNLTTAMLQPLGLTQSMARIGPGWVVKGMGQWIKSPLETMGMIKEKSAMMTSRAQTMQREINEIQNQVNGSSLDPIRATFFVLIQKMQLLADVPTWLGAYEKHTAAGETEARAVALADQAVLDSQGGGQVKDLAQIQRGHPALKLFTNFYSYFNVSYNLAAEKTNEKIGSPKMYPSLAMDYILLLIAPSVLATLIRNIMSGDDDDLADKLAADQISYLLGLMVGAREITAAVQKVAGVEQFKGSYGGPAGLRMFQEIDKLGTQIGQGEADAALLKSANNVGGILLHYPSGQINRSVEGTAAIMEGKTDNPAAVFLGPPRK